MSNHYKNINYRNQVSFSQWPLQVGEVAPSLGKNIKQCLSLLVSKHTELRWYPLSVCKENLQVRLFLFYIRTWVPSSQMFVSNNKPWGSLLTCISKIQLSASCSVEGFRTSFTQYTEYQCYGKEHFLMIWQRFKQNLLLYNAHTLDFTIQDSCVKSDVMKADKRRSKHQCCS